MVDLMGLNARLTSCNLGSVHIVFLCMQQDYSRAEHILGIFFKLHLLCLHASSESINHLVHSCQFGGFEWSAVPVVGSAQPDDRFGITLVNPVLSDL